MSNEKYLVPLSNGGILDIRTDAKYYPGCETCDFGSSYVNNVTIEMTTGNIEIKVDQMCNYALSEGYMMKLLIANIDAIRQMEEQEFFQWLKAHLQDEYGKILRVCVFSKK